MSALLPNMLTKQVILDGLRYILAGHFRIKDAHLPSAGHTVPIDFMGVCVASNDDPATDDYIIGQLNNLGLKRVRIDIREADKATHPRRFLNALLANGFDVTVHLVQPFEHARNMHLAEYQAQWQSFVSDIVNSYAGKIKAVEIGNTINRKRWAGYFWTGFMHTWRIAHQIARSHNITIIGPNIQDFEPLYNISVLKRLKEQDLLPDVHSNNLFVERVIEPERFDHRIFKFKWTQRFHYNLIKKARLLQKIGQDFGVKQMVSPVAFWAIYRIQRHLPDGPQKQADYAARYFTLLAASGALVQTNWGALICQREGLIDDGLHDDDYPKLERVAYYQQADGHRTHYRPYPSFAAVKTVAYWLQGARYMGAIATTEHLEIHHFVNHGKQIHIAWTSNARTALLNHLYQANSLNKADILHRDGQAHHNPQLLSESPIYLVWSQAEDIAMHALPFKASDTHIHAHVRNNHINSLNFYPFEDETWQGMLLASSKEQSQQLAQALHPSTLSPPKEKQQALRHARNAIWAMPDPRDEDRQITIKQPVKMHLHKAYLDRFKPSKAKRSWNGAMELMRRGVATAPPVAFFEHKRDKTLKQNFYICEFVPADFTIAQAFIAFSQGQTEFAGYPAQQVYTLFAQFCNHMHASGIYFRDFSGGNILVSKRPQQQLAFSLIDTARLHAYPNATPFKYRLADLTRALNKLHQAGRVDFLQRYLSMSGKTLTWRHLIPFYLYDAKVTLKRTIGRKAIKRLLRHIKGA